MNKTVLMAAIAAAGLLVVGSANAATVTDQFQVTATVKANCKISGATDLAFGDYTPEAGDVDGLSTVSVRCSKGASYDIGLDAGIGAGATVSDRKMTLTTGTDTLAYALYSDSYVTNWGNTPSTDTKSGTGTGLGVVAAQDYTVSGRLVDSAANQAAPVGSYADTITVTVTY
jgi:spore coat protein U-like protein